MSVKALLGRLRSSTYSRERESHSGAEKKIKIHFTLEFRLLSVLKNTAFNLIETTVPIVDVLAQ